jgi:predicted anti-sigma-YlaC factor YlaD
MSEPGSTCDRVQAALSARLDGEDPGMAEATVQDHLERCPRCRAFDRATGSARLLPVDTTPPGPERAGARQPGVDLSGTVTAAAGRVDRAGVWWLLRALLGVVAVGYLVTAVPELLFSNEPHHAHLARHLGAFEAAYGVALLFVAVRPAKARAMVPFTIALAAAMGVVMVVDLVNGNATPLTELSHVLEVAGLVLVWALATRRGWPGRHEIRSDGRRPGPGSAVEHPPPSRPTLVVASDSGKPQVPRQRAG